MGGQEIHEICEFYHENKNYLFEKIDWLQKIIRENILIFRLDTENSNKKIPNI